MTLGAKYVKEVNTVIKVYQGILLVLLVLLTSGCAQIRGWIPSFSDPNQSARIIDVRQSVERLDCSQPQLAQALKIQQDLEWFELYSQSKGWRQADVLRVIEPMKATVADFVKRSQTGQGTRFYCDTKKKIMQEQASTAARAILGRF